MPAQGVDVSPARREPHDVSEVPLLEMGCRETPDSDVVAFSRRLKREVRRRKEGRVIILKNSIQTSNRKLRLYGTKEYLRLIRGFLFRGKKMLKDREALNIWYDGRR